MNTRDFLKRGQRSKCTEIIKKKQSSKLNGELTEINTVSIVVKLALNSSLIGWRLQSHDGSEEEAGMGEGGIYRRRWLWLWLWRTEVHPLRPPSSVSVPNLVQAQRVMWLGLGSTHREKGGGDNGATMWWMAASLAQGKARLMAARLTSPGSGCFRPALWPRPPSPPSASSSWSNTHTHT